MKSTYKNWRSRDTNESPLSGFSVSEGTNENGLDLTFKNDFGKRITFYLNEEDKNLLLIGINKIVKKTANEIRNCNTQSS